MEVRHEGRGNAANLDENISEHGTLRVGNPKVIKFGQILAQYIATAGCYIGQKVFFKNSQKR